MLNLFFFFTLFRFIFWFSLHWVISNVIFLLNFNWFYFLIENIFLFNLYNIWNQFSSDLYLILSFIFLIFSLSRFITLLQYFDIRYFLFDHNSLLDSFVSETLFLFLSLFLSETFVIAVDFLFFNGNWMVDYFICFLLIFQHVG